LNLKKHLKFYLHINSKKTMSSDSGSDSDYKPSKRPSKNKEAIVKQMF